MVSHLKKKWRSGRGMTLLLSLALLSCQVERDFDDKKLKLEESIHANSRSENFRSLSDEMVSGEDQRLPWSLDVYVQYHDRIYDQHGYEGEHRLSVSPWVRVELYSTGGRTAENGEGAEEARPLAEAYTDDRGVASLRWWGPRLDAYSSDKRLNQERFKVYVVSELGSPLGHRAIVTSRRDGSVYRLEAENSPRFEERSKSTWWAPNGEVVGSAMRVTAPPEGHLSGALNILSMLARGYEMISLFSEETGPLLTVSWDLDQAVPCGSCYVGDQILLGGQPEDPDHYDDHIILHEMGHHFTHRWSVDDSPGGPHRGRAVHPTLAYGEGVAYFWSSLVLMDPVIVDWMFPDPWVVDLERSLFNGQPMTWGLWQSVPSEQLEAQLSATHHEELVSSLMWGLFTQLFDQILTFDGFDEQHERSQGAVDLIMSVLLRDLPQKMSAGFDVGAEGVDLADWLDSVSCHAMSRTPDFFEAIYNELEQSGADREYPWSWSERREEACVGKAIGERLQLILDEQSGGHYRVTLSRENQTDGESVDTERDRAPPAHYLWRLWTGAPPMVKLERSGRCEALPCELREVVLSEERTHPVIFTLSPSDGGPDEREILRASWLSKNYLTFRDRGVSRVKEYGRSLISELGMAHHIISE